MENYYEAEAITAKGRKIKTIIKDEKIGETISSFTKNNKIKTAKITKIGDVITESIFDYIIVDNYIDGNGFGVKKIIKKNPSELPKGIMKDLMINNQCVILEDLNCIKAINIIQQQDLINN